MNKGISRRQIKKIGPNFEVNNNNLVDKEKSKVVKDEIHKMTKY